jgi:hypothetical protein
VVASDRLIDTLWGDAPPDDSANALQRQVSSLGALDATGSHRAICAQTSLPWIRKGLMMSIVSVTRFDGVSVPSSDYAPVWINRLADDVTLEGSAMNGVANYRPRTTLLLVSRLVGEHFADTPYGEHFASKVLE